MDKAPFFSIITPTYNRASFLEEMVASVAAQTFTDYEHIIVDDGSTDETEKLIKRLMETHPKIVYIKQENKGRSTARNVGIEDAKGEYICFLDSDDFWKQNHLEVLRTAIDELSQPTLIHTGLIWYYDGQDKEQEVAFLDLDKVSSNVEYALRQQFAPNTVCMPKSILLQENFEPQLNVNEDIDLWCRVLSVYPLKIVQTYTAYLRVHQGNTKNMRNQMVFFQKQIDVFQKLKTTKNTAALITPEFTRNYLMGLRHRKWNATYMQGTLGALLVSTIQFCVNYPANPSVKSKLVAFIKKALQIKS